MSYEDLNFLPTFIFIANNSEPLEPSFSKRKKLDFYELVYVVCPNDIQHLNNDIKIMQPGDIVLRKPNDFAQAYTTSQNIRIGFNISNNLSFVNSIPSFFTPKDKNKYLEKLNSILSIYPKEILTRVKRENLLLSILLDLYIESTKKTDQHRLEKSIQYICDNFQRNITMKEIALASSLSKSYFHHLFKEIYNTTPNQYLMRIRLEYACNKMQLPNLELSNIATISGFSSLQAFEKSFESYFSETAQNFRAKYLCEY